MRKFPGTRSRARRPPPRAASRVAASTFSCCHENHEKPEDPENEDPENKVKTPLKSPLRIAVAGLGTVGAGTLQLLERQAELLALRAGRRIIVVAVSAQDRRRDRGIDLSAVRWYEDAVAMAADPEVDVAVEVIGGSGGGGLGVLETADPPKKHAVPPHKALVAEHRTRLSGGAAGARPAPSFEAGGARGL